MACFGFIERSGLVCASERRFRVLAIVDDFIRACLGLVVDTSLSGARVVREPDWIPSAERRGYPLIIVSDNSLPPGVQPEGHRADIARHPALAGEKGPCCGTTSRLPVR